MHGDKNSGKATKGPRGENGGKKGERAERKIHDRRSRKRDSRERQSDFELINVPQMLCARVCVRHFL